MFRGVTEIKGLAIDVDSFDVDYPLEFEKLSSKYSCVFLTANEAKYKSLIKSFDVKKIIFMDAFQRFFAPNVTVHLDVINRLGVKSQELAYVSTSHNFIKNAIGFLSCVVWITKHISYKEASVLPDLLLQDLSQLENALMLKHDGFFGETKVDPTRDGRGTMYPITFEYEEDKFVVYALGRYYGHGHYMNQIHPYSKAILSNKKEKKPYTGVFNDIFQVIYSRAVKRLKSHYNVDGICAVPVKPGKQDRYKDIVSKICEEHKLENFGKNFHCIREYQEQKNCLSTEERMKNIKGAFKYDGSLVGKKIILIDDIISTGSTVRECVNELRTKGAETVIVLVLAVNQFGGNYWFSDIPGVICPVCEDKMKLQVSKDRKFFYSCLNCFQLDQKSPTVGFANGMKQILFQENARFTDQAVADEYDDSEWISLKRNVLCPHCNGMMQVDIEDACLTTEYDREMGIERLYEFDIDDCECKYCENNFRVSGHISEYPLGVVSCENINVSKK